MQERLLSAQQGSRQPLGQAVLYFGCRRSDQDYLYGGLLEGWAKAGQLTLFTAFSRQQVRDAAILTTGLHISAFRAAAHSPKGRQFMVSCWATSASILPLQFQQGPET